MEKMTTVIVERGEHQHPVPRGTEKFVAAELERRGVKGAFKLRWGPPVKGTSHTARFMAVQATARNTVELHIKPGSNDTSHVAWLIPYGGSQWRESGATLEQLLTALQTEPSINPPSPGAGFTDNDGNIAAVLRVISAIGEGKEVYIGQLRDQLSELYPSINRTKGWGVILSAIERRGLISSTRNTQKEFVSISLTERGEARLPPAMRNGHKEPLAPTIARELDGQRRLAEPRTPLVFKPPTSSDSASLRAWLAELEKSADDLLASTLREEQELKELEGRVEAKHTSLAGLTAELAQASKVAEAARTLLALPPREGKP